MATAFPSGRSSLEVKLADTQIAVDAGADEIDMVIDRGAFLAGRYGAVFDQIVAVKAACGVGPAQGDPGDRRAGHLRQRPPGVLAGPAGRRRLHQDLHRQGLAGRHPAGDPRDAAGGQATGTRPTGERRAVKPAGGIRTAKDAIRYLVAVHEVAGPEWLDPYYFRFGASSVLNDLIMQRRAQLDGHYSGSDYVTVD